MDRRAFISATLAATAGLTATPALALGADGDGFAACVTAGLRDDTSAAARVTALLAQGFVEPDQADRDLAGKLIGEGLAMFNPRPLSGAPTDATYLRRNIVNTAANIARPGADGRVSVLLKFDEPAGPVFAYLLQGRPGGHVSIAAACKSANSITAFLQRYVSPLPPLQPGSGFDRITFDVPAGSATRSRMNATRIDIPTIQDIASTFSAAGALVIKTASL